MNELKSYPLPIKFEVICMVTGRRTGSLSFNTWLEKFRRYGAGHSHVDHREELIAHYQPDAAAFNGLWHMILSLDPQKPFNKIQQTLILAAFPNTAKKLLLSLKTPGEMIEWARKKPDELMEVAGCVLPSATEGIRDNRARQVLGTEADISAWLRHGTLPPAWQKVKDTENARRLAAANALNTAATTPASSPKVEPPVVTTTDRLDALIDNLSMPVLEGGAYTARTTTGANAGIGITVS